MTSTLVGPHVRIEADAAHAPLARRSVVTIVLTGGDLAEREAAARAIIEQVLPPIAARAAIPPRPPEGLAGLFTLLSSPPPRAAPLPPPLPAPVERHAEPVKPQPHPVVRSAPSDPQSAYDEPFILAPIV